MKQEISFPLFLIKYSNNFIPIASQLRKKLLIFLLMINQDKYHNILPTISHHPRAHLHKKKLQNRNQQLKKIFGEHYNYNYHRPNQHKMYRIQQNKNTEIERANRILLQRMRTIFGRSGPYAQDVTYYVEETDEEHEMDEKIFKRNNKNNNKKRQRSINIDIEKHLQENQKNQRDKRKYHSNEVSPARKIRRKTEEILKKSSVNRIQTVQKPYLQQLQHSKLTKKQVHQYRLLFHGQTLISGYDFELYITLDSHQYRIQAKKINLNYAKKQRNLDELICIPNEDYLKFYETVLERNHTNILKYLHVNGGIGFLEIEGFRRREVDVRQSGEINVIEKSRKRKIQVNQEWDMSEFSISRMGSNHSQPLILSEFTSVQQSNYPFPKNIPLKTKIQSGPSSHYGP